MSQNHRIHLSNRNTFSTAKKHHKKLIPLAMTPWLAACELFDGNTTPVPPENTELEELGYIVHRSANLDGDTFIGSYEMDAIIGSQGNDTFNGEGGNDLIYGNEGDDELIGGTGADEIYGGAGDDFISPGADLADDYIDGGEGVDTLSYAQHFGKMEINLEDGEVYINNNLEDKIVNIENVEGAENAQNTIIGNDENNQFKGGKLGDLLEGGAGKDILYGQAGDDKLVGGEGNDELHGGDGDDILLGGQGSDALYGGNGADAFVFADIDIETDDTSNDIIYDFELGVDRIYLGDLSFIANFADVSRNMVQNGDGVDVFLHATDDHIIRFENVLLAEFSSQDFIFI